VNFEWDEEKRKKNFLVHQVDFTRAARVLMGPILEAIDDSENHGEVRVRAIREYEGNITWSFTPTHWSRKSGITSNPKDYGIYHV